MTKIKIFSFSLITIALLLPLIKHLQIKIYDYKSNLKVEEKIVNHDYYLILEINKINLKKEIHPINSKENNVNKNIMLHKDSTLPNNEISNVILAGHSGNGLNAYFKDLYKLNLGDEVNIYYKNIIYTYEIKKIEYQAKTGELYLLNNYPKMLTLITCTHNDKTKQTIYYCALKSQKRIENN